ncbi:MAG: aspartate carbamoyltransferase regulatory subunit [Thermoplasmata archaeon]
MDEQTLKVQKIKNGIVLDHIDSGFALKVLKILGIEDDIGSTISILMHVSSKSKKFKDIVKIEDRYIGEKEINKISLITTSATVNIIKNYEVTEKYRVQVPKSLKGIVKCSNPSCVTNQNEPIEPEFITISSKPIKIKCKYCEREMDQQDILKNIM